MASVNKVILVGRIGQNPELRTMNNGSAICNITVATDESYTDRDGIKQKSTEWHKVTLFAKQAEFCANYLHKGSQVYIEGSLATRKYTDKQGIERYTTEIKAQRLQALDRPDGNGQQANGNRYAPDDNDVVGF